MSLLRAFILSMALTSFVLLINSEPSAATKCDDDVRTLIVRCSRFVSKIGPQVDPSSECCEIVQQADLGCICSKVTKTIENMISMTKALHVAAYCKKSVPHGYQCGSYKIPMV